jgi:hypothetical protein
MSPAELLYFTLYTTVLSSESVCSVPQSLSGCAAL